MMSTFAAKVTVVFALTVALGLVGMAQKAAADYGSATFLMNITNTKTGTIKTIQWQTDRYQFEESFAVNVDPLKERKLMQIFGTNEFVFKWQLREYEAIWHHFKVSIATDVQPTNPMKVTFTQLKVGDELMNNSKAQANDSELNAHSIKTFVSADKEVYTEGERAMVFIAFVDANDRFVDPEGIFVNFYVTPAGNILERKNVGSYLYITPPLEEGENQIVVVPEKERYRLGAESIGIAVLPTISAG